MKKNILKTLFLSVLVSPFFASCELDQYPEMNDLSDREWESVSYAARFNTGLLSTLRGATEGSLGGLMDAQADLFNLGGRSISYISAHDWTFTAAGFSGDALWGRGFTLINNANNILTKIDSIKPATQEEADLLSNFKANAYFARAYAYASMAERYCENYETDEKAKTQKGLPLIEVVDVEARPSRASLFDTYEFIKSDIEKAKELYSNKEDNKKIAEPSYFATMALEARVNLNSCDYLGAIDCAEQVMPYYPLAQDANEFAYMWAFDEGTEIIYQPLQTIEEKMSSFSAFITFDTSEGMFRPDYFPTQGLLDLYEMGDMRGAVYFTGKMDVTAGQGFNEKAIIFRKFPGNENLRKQGESYQFFNMTKVFRAAELYLIASEAQYKIDQTLSPYFNLLRSARGASEVDEDLTGDKLFKVIKDEWAREMCGEGFRLNCIKRWGDSVDRKAMKPQALKESFLRGTGYNDLVVRPGDDLYYKIIWEIPSGDLTTNGNLEKNWNN